MYNIALVNTDLSALGW